MSPVGFTAPTRLKSTFRGSFTLIDSYSYTSPLSQVSHSTISVKNQEYEYFHAYICNYAWQYISMNLPAFSLYYLQFRFRPDNMLQTFTLTPQHESILSPEMPLNILSIVHFSSQCQYTLPRNHIWLKILVTRQFNPKSFNIHISKPFQAIFKKSYWHPRKIWHFGVFFLLFFGVFGCHFHSAALFPGVFLALLWYKFGHRGWEKVNFHC